MPVGACTEDHMNAQTARIRSFVPFFGMSRYESGAHFGNTPIKADRADHPLRHR